MDIQWTQTWPNSLHQCLVVAAIQEEADFAHIPLLDAHLAAPPNLPEGWGETRKRLVLSMGKQQGLLLYLAKDASLEDWRKVAHQATKSAQEFGYAEVLWLTVPEGPALEALLEASLLTNYQFLPYRSKPKPFSVRAASLWGQPTKETQAAVSRGQQLAEATCVARDLVNEPVITLTATELGNRITHLGNTYGFETEVMGLAKIQSLQMGGLLAVNAGSEEPPSFSILHHKPEKPILDAPVVLVGKGVVFDTGGLSLKPTANSMDFMKSDMGGAAAVIGAMCGIAARNLPIEVIGLVPSTDNRPGKNAYVPGDVIQMMSGSTVEVLNTDAEGRMLLADALHFAKRYEPALVVDLATLTGASVVAVGHEGISLMQTAGEQVASALKQAGEQVYERLVEFPLWKEYGEQLRSDIADIKNIGGRWAGAITAGKFLEHFTDYPWVHLDIAGSAWLPGADSYRGKNGTGAGVRLLIEFLERHYEQSR